MNVARPESPETTELAEHLARDLVTLARAGGSVPTMPFPVLAALRNLVPLPVVELCIDDGNGAFLLTWREDAHWRGWHFPGGFMAPSEGLFEACQRIAWRELGTGFHLEGVAGVECWPRHAYASVVALLCRGRLDGPPSEGRFFAEPPPDLLVDQATYFTSLRAVAIVAADLGRGGPVDRN